MLQEGHVNIDFGMWNKALQGVPRISKDEWDRLDLISRWLIATRAMALVSQQGHWGRKTADDTGRRRDRQ